MSSATLWLLRLLLVLGVLSVALAVSFAVHMEVAPREIDDVHPWIPCQAHWLADSTWWWVIPLYGDQPLTADPAWVEHAKQSGKKLGMHGVRHTYAEFNTDVSREYVQKGIDEFERAFGYKPTDFKPPKMQITPHNLRLLREMGLTVHTTWQQNVHKIYHCEDHGRTDRWRLRYELELGEDEPVPRLATDTPGQRDTLANDRADTATAR